MKLSRVINNGNPRWRVSTYVKGQRRQRFFKSRKKARLWITTLEADVRCDGFWGQRTPSEQLQIMEAFSASSEQGFRLIDAVSFYHGKSCKVSASIRDAVTTYLGTIDDKTFRPVSIKKSIT